MAVVACPKCRDEVTVPPGASPEALVRCPLCWEEYALSEALRKLPPSLIVIDDAESGEYADSSGAARPFAFEEAAAPKAAAPAQLRTVPRPRQQTSIKRVAIMLVMWVGGGVLGLSLGYLLIWWVIRKDPFELGPPVSRIFAPIVPAEFRAPPDLDEGSNADGTDQPIAAADWPPLRSSNTQNDVKELVSQSGTPFDQRTGNGDRGSPSLTPSSGNGGPNGSAASSSKFGPDGKPIVPAGPPDETVPPELPVLGAQYTTIAELDGAIRAVQTAHATLAEAEADDAFEKQVLEDALHDSLAYLGNVVTFVDPTDREIQMYGQELHSLLLSIIDAPTKSRSINGRSVRRLNDNQRNSAGLALVGTLKEVKDHGSLYESRIQLELTATDQKDFADDRELSVFGWHKPDNSFQPGAKILMLGSIVVDPSINLQGYEGDEPQVVCGGYFVILTGAKPPVANPQIPPSSSRNN